LNPFPPLFSKTNSPHKPFETDPIACLSVRSSDFWCLSLLLHSMGENER
jgi:hypothetical protein